MTAMPPLPSALREESKNLIGQLNRHQKDIQEFQIPRLRNFKGFLTTQQQYAGELREDMEMFARNVQTLGSLAEDYEQERERREVVHRTRQFKNTLDQMRKDMRIALLTSKRAIDSLATSNRDELLRSTVLSEKSSDEKSGDALTNANNDVTEALRRTIGLMQGELERSVLSSQMLEQSSANLRSTTTTHDTLTTLLSTSKHLITALEKSDWLDRLLILAAVVFFLLVVLFILKQRVVDKGVRIAFWWTRFLPNFHDGAELLKAETAKAGVIITTTTATAFSTASSLCTTMNAAQISSHDSQEVKDLSAVLVPPLTLSVPNLEWTDETVQELPHSSGTTSPPNLRSHISTMPHHNEPSQHQEL